MAKQVKIINNTIGSFSFIGADGRKYYFPKKNSYRMIDVDIVQNLYNDYPNTFSYGYLIFDDRKLYSMFDFTEEDLKKILTLEQINDFIEQDAETLKEELAELPLNIQENVARVAKEKKIDSTKKKKAIKEATGFDVEPDEEE